ncbi:FtsX-like permease family protein [Micromonospora sp. MS34]|uniref:FtsX-like permease family protein n=1 Tax=Micromonospora sp. MS34 TaxID=3385971 RepID=UPI0039A10DBE
MTGVDARRPGGRLRAGLGDVAMGARMAVTGGRAGWTRTVLTALGVGIGVAMLLLAAAVPGAIDARGARGEARFDLGRPGPELAAGPDTMLVAAVDTVFRDRPVRGRLLHPEGPDAPVPPGLTALPRDGEVMVSPALRELLDSPDGALFAPRLGGARVIGTIGPQGLTGPRELAFYLGRDALSADRATRLDHFGGSGPVDEFGPVLWLLVVVVGVVLLLPIVVFLGAAVRFGGEQRDRRLAAVRLLGADAGMVRRIAAAEAGTAALLGLAVGGVFFLAGRQLALLVSLYDISVYPDDLRPVPWLVAVVALAVPLLAAGMALLALRRVVVTPLGVSRQATPARRRLWWRLLLPAAGLALLQPVADVRTTRSDATDGQIATGAVLLLIGTVTLLPWLVDLLVRRLRGGPPPWQLAVRRLQLDSTASARLVSGVAVAVAGTIGLQMLVAGVQDEFRQPSGQDPTRAQAVVLLDSPSAPWQALAQIAAVPGVTRSAGTLSFAAFPASSRAAVDVRVGDCSALAEYADVGTCADGDVFLTWRDDPVPGFTPGARVDFGEGTETWQMPTGTRTVPVRADPVGAPHNGLLITPGALGPLPAHRLTATALVRLDPTDGDALERLRSGAAGIDLTGSVLTLDATRESRQFANVRRGLLIGAVVTLLLIGLSMLVGVLEQLRERRRLLATLVAVGTPRGTLGWSVLGQTGVPVLAGLVLAAGIGIAMGAALLRLVGAPVVVSWPVVGLGVGLGAAVVLLVTGASLPVLWRLTRPDGLRAE